MRKLICIVFLTMMMAVPMMAQVTFGARVGGAYSCLVQKVEGLYESGARFGFSVAGLVDIPLYKRLSLRPELAFVNQGGSYISNFEVEGAKNSLYKCSYYSIQIPVNLAYTFVFRDVQFGVFAGPALDFSLFGKMKSENQHIDIQFGQNSESDLKNFDLGVNVGLRVDYRNYFFSVGALCGTLDRRSDKKDGESSLYQNNVTLSVGYMFR
ncbi:MAG: porin family protein [Parabacteroides sp.]|nr:porin family protein [Parabacteroides sp.]